VTVPAPELLSRLATTLREEIGPSVSAAYPRTQGFMAAVVLEKMARQLALASAHEHADRAEMAQLFTDLRSRLGAASTPPAVRAIVNERGNDDGSERLCRLVEALYAHRVALGPSFDATLGRVRATLRARVDRQMEYAR
jgi:hypothetical protein